jgi:tetratricopeptide (TPR) repeat protein
VDEQICTELAEQQRLAEQVSVAKAQLSKVTNEAEDKNFVRSLADLTAKGDPADALRLLRAYMAKVGECRPALFDMEGTLLLRMGRPADALRAFDQSLYLRPHHPDTLNDRGVALRQLGRLAEAEACFREALIARPCAEVLNNLGVVLSATGRLAEAIATFDRAMTADGQQQQQSGTATALRNKGEALRQMGELEEALACIAESLRLRPDHAETMAAHRAIVSEIRRRHKCHVQ